MTTELQVRMLLRAAEREERLSRGALVIAETAMNAAANEHASLSSRHVKADEALDRWRAAQERWRAALRRWRLAKDSREIAARRQAS